MNGHGNPVFHFPLYLTLLLHQHHLLSQSSDISVPSYQSTITLQLTMERPIFFLTSMLAISFFLITLPKSLCQENYSACNRLFNCGTITNIGYPFWSQTQNRPSYCGRDDFELYCQDNQNTYIQIGSQKFRVLNIDPHAYSMRMERTDLVYDNCSSNFTNTSLSTQLNLFSYMPNVENITLFYNCTDLSIGRNNFTCHTQTQTDQYVFYGYEDSLLSEFPDLDKCKGSIKVPISRDHPPGPEGGIEALLAALRYGFEVHYSMNYSSLCTKCAESKGICGSGLPDNSPFTCYCQDGPHASDCNDNMAGKRRIRLSKLFVGFITGGIGALLLCIIIFYLRRKLSLIMSADFWDMTKSDQDIETFIRNHGPLTIKRYTFSEIKKMTNSFEVKLGEGGYGSVYKGNIFNGCPAAVKVLKVSEGNGEEFINEVVSISRTSHVNIVTLLCFCLEGRKKALVYELMPNGSLEKFIYNSDFETNPPLSWERLHQISEGIARGLEYLHRGCNTRILHLDIKPNNILLDKDFCPKISDFGLAKLCSKTQSVISMLDARGTIGYIAPEVWNRNFGGVSHKSDVYSYGMLILEMAGGRNNKKREVSHSSDIYFPHWVYKHIELNNNIAGYNGPLTTEEKEIAKKMMIVGLWCTQTIPSDRPPMSRVIEMLKGRLEQLQIPPKPFIFSPTRTGKEYCTTTDHVSSSSYN